MSNKYLILFVLLLGCLTNMEGSQAQDTDSCDCRRLLERKARRWTVNYNTRISEASYEAALAEWNQMTNATETNYDIQTEKSLVKGNIAKESALVARSYDWQNFENRTLKRMFSKIVDIGTSILSDEDSKIRGMLARELQDIYNKATVCNKPGDTSDKCYPLAPDLMGIMADPNSDWDTLEWAWTGFRNATEPKMLDTYDSFVEILNKAAVLNEFTDAGAYWRSWYESETFREDCEQLWTELKPLYVELHAYVLRKLKEKYPDRDFPQGGHIPAHILGNMWAQQWDALESIVRPYPAVPGLDVSDEMIRQNYTPLKMFQLADEFFTSLGLIPMPAEFWNGSIITKQPDVEMNCQPVAVDFYNGKDFRIVQCTEVNMYYLTTTHHEMGHIQYFLQYKDLPNIFKDGANPGVHEAIGETIALSVTTPEHLVKIGLAPDFVDNLESDLNFQMLKALETIAFMPFGYLIDQWRWDVFAGNVDKSQYNEHWWNFRCKYQGIAPPVKRTSSDFDPGAKFHVPVNVPYIRYFVALILQFQFQKALCTAANNTRPLHRCDIYESQEAGNMLSKLMKLGSSIPWPDALEQMIGTRKMSAGPILEYFAPLRQWLEKENEGHPKGWDESCPPGSIVP